MSRFKTASCVLAGCIVLAAGITAQGQGLQGGLPTGTGYGADGLTTIGSQSLFPNVDPREMDFQWFAPSDLGEFGEQPQGNSGVYGAFDYVNLRVSRPEAETILFPNPLGTDFSLVQGPDPYGFDSTTGRRIEVGWMPDHGAGWNFTALKVRGPNAGRPVLVRERDFDPTDDENDPADPDFDPFNDQIVLPTTFNSGNLSTYELNRTWRLAETHRGGVVEPYAGLRWSRFVDKTQVGAVDLVPDAGPLGNRQEVRRVFAGYNNEMLGAQLGGRWYTTRGRWKLTGDLKLFGAQSFQRFGSFNSLEIIHYDAAFIAEVAPFRTITTREFNDSESEFVWGQEARLEVAFTLYRDFAIRVGGQFINFADGIGRGPTLATNEQDLIMGGLVIGLEANR